MSNEEFLVNQGRTPKLTYTVQQDWCDLMPITHGAARLYRILRSMMVENGQSAAKPTRSLTMDRLCWIMSSFQSKPVGEQTIRDYRRELVECQMLDIVPGRGRTDPPSYVVHDVPPDEWVGWRNGWHVDDAYTPDWRTNRPVPRGTGADSGQFIPRTVGGKKTKGKAGHSHPRASVSPGSSGGFPEEPGGYPEEPWVEPPLSSPDGPPKEVLKEGLKKSSSSSSSIASPGAAGGPPEEDEDVHDQKQNRPKATQKSEQILEALTTSRGIQLQGPDWASAVGYVRALLESGWTQVQIDSIFKHDSWDRIHSPHRFLLKRLGAAVGTSGVQTIQERTESLLGALRAARERQLADIEACPGCSAQGRTDLGWHGHGDKDLKERIWILERPVEAAGIAELNAQARKAAS